MPIQASGPVSFPNIANVVYNSTTIQISLNDTDVRYLLGRLSGTISMSDAYGKPTAGNTGVTYNTAGSYTFYVPAYQYLSVEVSGGGQGGNGGTGCAFYPFIGCFNCAGGNAGGAGGNSSFSFGSITAYGGTSVGVGTGIGGTVTAGGGGAGGAAGSGANFCPTGGSAGRAGGRVNYNNWKKAVDGPNYNAALSITVGAGGAGGAYNGGTGGTGRVFVSWS